MMGRITVAALLASAVAVAGCGGSSTSASTSTSTTTVAASTTTTVAATTTSGATTSAPTTTATTPPTTGTGRCTAVDLTAGLQGPANGAAGTIFYTIKATNISGAPCVTGGYFGVSTYDVGGQPISTQDTRLQQNALQSFTVAAGGSLSFMVGLNDVPSSQGSCPQVGAFHLIPPNDTRYVQLSLLNSSGEGTSALNCPGDLSVSPVAPA
jgi:hypothetical protein